MFSALNKARKEMPFDFYMGIITIIVYFVFLYFILWAFNN